VATVLNMPSTSDTVETCSNNLCYQGQCIQYSNNTNGATFCRCNYGWTGRYCDIPFSCTCSSDSLCLGILANNRSLCLCPLLKWGSQCLLQSIVCQSDQSNTCQNGGQCIPVDDNMISDRKYFMCICQRDFTGDRCEQRDTKIIVSLHQIISLPQSVLFHFIRMIENAVPENGSTFKAITGYQNSVTVHWSRPFHVAFVDLFNNSYFLIIVQKEYNQSATIIRTINPTDRCKHINELLNETIINYHLLRRIKYYHLPCQHPAFNLSCFYDEIHMCLCNDYNHQRISNCFEFNHTIKHDCFGQSKCENKAQCLQDKVVCPQTSICVCPSCFYGTLCQFSSSLFGLSLDAILGYHIQPNVNMIHPLSIVQVSVVWAIIMIITGFVNGVLSIITFQNKETQEIGCGLYLLGSSIAILFTMIIFALKFWILMIAQMTYITNRLFLQVQCLSLDFLLQIGLHMDQWLNACVAIERAIAATKKANFDKSKSRKVAKYIILVLLILVISTTVHDPICIDN
jgi:hypothetical protein